MWDMMMWRLTQPKGVDGDFPERFKQVKMGGWEGTLSYTDI